MVATKKSKITNPTPTTLVVKTDKVVGSAYSQLVGVTVTDVDITLDFVYINPRPPVREGNVIARITLPRVVGEGLVKDIINIVRVHEEKKIKKGDKNGTN